MNRRELLKGLMAGGMIVAGELWIPGQKMISIPRKQFFGPPIFELVGERIVYVGPPDKTATVTQLYNWAMKQFPNMLANDPHDTVKPHMVSLRSGYSMENPEHLVEGTFEQDRVTAMLREIPDREYWSSTNSLGDDELITDKVYQPAYYSTPRERLSENENGEKGWR